MTPAERSTWPEAWPKLDPAPLTGRRELAAAELAAARGSRPERVTALIAALADRIGGAPATPELVRRLSAGTREWLLQQLAASCRPAEDWFELTCPDCGAVFDLGLDLARMPRGGPGEGFAAVEVATSAGSLAFDCLNGWHEEAVARAARPGLRVLLSAAARFDDAEAVLAGLPVAELHAIEAALDAAGPEVADRVEATCPGCGVPVSARLDPLSYAFPGDATLLGEVHALSWAYRWSEPAILDLPSGRRRRYSAMVATMGARA